MNNPPIAVEEEFIEVLGAREHNLKNIDISIPRNKLVVITGLSGSGKSSLAFDTIYAEGQRRYMESFNAYARQFLGNMERPEVDKINGLSPVISIEQKTTNRNPRSTVGTVTEIYDFLRLLYARAAKAYSYHTGELMQKYSDDEIVDTILQNFNGKKTAILAPLIKGRKGHYRELFEQIQKQGFTKARVDGEIVEVATKPKLDRYKIHDIEVVIDRLVAKESDRERIYKSVQTAIKQGKGELMVMDIDSKMVKQYSRNLMCSSTGISYEDPQPNSFSFNSPYGACPKCLGLGNVAEIDRIKLIPDEKKSIRKGGIIALGEFKNNWIFTQLQALAEKYKFSLDGAISDIPEEGMNAILFGSEEVLKVKSDDGKSNAFSMNFEGIVPFLLRQSQEASSKTEMNWIRGFLNRVECPVCQGARLKKEAIWFKIGKYAISDLCRMNISDLITWLENIELELDARQLLISKEIIKEIRARVGFLFDVGLTYLSLDRNARSLSGGEAQRIRLATQIGSQLVGVLYILDEPSIGLHQRDNTRLINALKKLRDTGNSVLVVEHDRDMMMESDHLIDVGPGAGIHGGRIVAQGKPQEVAAAGTITADYLCGKKSIQIPLSRRKGNGQFLVLKGASGNNLKNLTVKFPLGKFICVTGVSGSGKSSLISETLYPILSGYFYKSEDKPLEYSRIEGLEYLDKCIEIDQSPIGRTPRSNPATYTGVMDEIRNLFSNLPEAKIRGYKPGRFSFNVKGGRCETCQGAGMKTIEMNFLPDVYIQCETCQGKRYNRETLDIRYKGKSINDVLNMDIDTAVHFFEAVPFIVRSIKTLQEVGLGYITLGQQSTTLSGGEAQRIKLATELQKRDTGKTIYVLDEPTTGLHFEDIRILLEVLNKLADKGNTIVVIEHNMDIIKMADHVIDIGPEGGKGGGTIVCEGTPEKVAKAKNSYTASYLQRELLQ